jgi:hypothetical protein
VRQVERHDVARQKAVAEIRGKAIRRQRAAVLGEEPDLRLFHRCATHGDPRDAADLVLRLSADAPRLAVDLAREFLEQPVAVDERLAEGQHVGAAGVELEVRIDFLVAGQVQPTPDGRPVRDPERQHLRIRPRLKRLFVEDARPAVRVVDLHDVRPEQRPSQNATHRLREAEVLEAGQHDVLGHDLERTEREADAARERDGGRSPAAGGERRFGWPDPDRFRGPRVENAAAGGGVEDEEDGRAVHADPRERQVLVELERQLDRGDGGPRRGRAQHGAEEHGATFDAHVMASRRRGRLRCIGHRRRANGSTRRGFRMVRARRPHLTLALDHDQGELLPRSARP